MNTYFIGQIVEVKPLHRKDKNSGLVTTMTNVTIMHKSKDVEGYDTIATTDVQLDYKDFDKLRADKGKYIAIPYMTINTKAGTYTFPDDSLDYVIFPSNPFDIPHNEHSKKAS